MSAQDRLDHIKALNKARSRKYYLENKDEIAKRRKAKRAGSKNAIVKVEQVEEKKEEQVEEKKEEPVPVPKRIRKKPTINKVNPLMEKKEEPQVSFDQAIEMIDKSIERPGSKKVYINNLKTLRDILKCEDFSNCLNDSKKVIQTIETAQKKKNPIGPYSLNTKKAIFQTILRVITILKLNLPKASVEEYTKHFKVYDVKSRDDQKEKSKEDNYIQFEEYLPKVNEKFGEDSKEYIIANLYKEAGLRDNLKELEIMKDIPPESYNKNAIVVPSSKKQVLTIVLNEYKTDKKYGRGLFKVSKKLSDLIRSYITKNQLTYNQLLFGKKSLSKFITEFNKKIGLNISINGLRQMRINPRLDGTAEERVQLADEMKHSPSTSQVYKRKLKK